MNNKTQKAKIFSWLKRRRKLTALKALQLFKCLRLSGRIKELRDDGVNIKTEFVKTDSGKWVAEYSLDK